eukprot:UN02898
MPKMYHNAPIWGYLAMQNSKYKRIIHQKLIKPIINVLKRILYVESATNTTELLLFEATAIEHPLVTMLSQASRAFIKMYTDNTINSIPNSEIVNNNINKEDDPFTFNIINEIVLLLGKIKHFDVCIAHKHCNENNSTNVKKFKQAIKWYNAIPLLPKKLLDQLYNMDLINNNNDILEQKMINNYNPLNNDDDDDNNTQITSTTPLPRYEYQAGLSPHYISLEKATTKDPWIFYVKHSIYNTLYWEACKRRSASVAEYIYYERNYYAKIDQKNAALFPEYDVAHTWYLSMINSAWGYNFFNYKN